MWTGKWLADHRGVAVAECRDSLEGLAELITGNRADKRLLRVRGQVQPGLRVDISPLLRVFENRVRQSVVAAAKSFYAPGFNHGSDYVREDQINQYFDPRDSDSADCEDAAWLILSKGLIDNLKPGEYDQLGLHPGNIPTVKRDGTPKQMLLGDMGYFKNYEEYGKLVGGNFQGENVVKIGPNQFFGWVGGSPSAYNWRNGVGTADQWVRELQDQFLRARGVTGPGKVPPHFTGEIQFLDTAIISMMAFDLRKQNLQH